MCNVTDTFKQIRDEICGTGTNVNHERIYICPSIEFDVEKQILSACFISISVTVQPSAELKVKKVVVKV
ncbi:MAG: hypothetical protein RR225_10125, partial [Clostridium sp.]